MTRQTLAILGERAKERFDGVLEIGSTGRYVSHFLKHASVAGDIVLVHTAAPTMGPVDILERGQVGVLGRFVPMGDYDPIPANEVKDESVDLVTCFIGLHHIEPEKVRPFLESIRRVLRPGGTFIVRDHDVTDRAMEALVALAHTVFNIGLGETWSFNQRELRFFAPVDTWVERIEAVGFQDLGHRVLQERDPTRNVLMGFVKTSAASKKRAAKKPAPAGEEE